MGRIFLKPKNWVCQLLFKMKPGHEEDTRCTVQHIDYKKLMELGELGISNFRKLYSLVSYIVKSNTICKKKHLVKFINFYNFEGFCNTFAICVLCIYFVICTVELEIILIQGQINIGKIKFSLTHLTLSNFASAQFKYFEH